MTTTKIPTHELTEGAVVVIDGGTYTVKAIRTTRAHHQGGRPKTAHSYLVSVDDPDRHFRFHGDGVFYNIHPNHLWEVAA